MLQTICGIAAVWFDRAFYDLFPLFPVYIFMESFSQFSNVKMIRMAVFLTIYSISIQGRLSVLWFIATALILLIEIVRERFNRTYIATIMQIMVLALLYQFGVGQLISMATLIILTILLRRLFLKKGRERP